MSNVVCPQTNLTAQQHSKDYPQTP